MPSVTFCRASGNTVHADVGKCISEVYAIPSCFHAPSDPALGQEVIKLPEFLFSTALQKLEGVTDRSWRLFYRVQDSLWPNHYEQDPSPPSVQEGQPNHEGDKAQGE